MAKLRLDQALVQQGLTTTRSQADTYIKLGYVKLNGKIVLKSGYIVGDKDKIILTVKEQYVSRAALKLASVADRLGVNFKDKVILDVGSSTGGFTDYALRHGAKKVIAVDVGSNQMHPSLRNDSRVDLYEKTDIRNIEKLSENPGLVLVDVSFISLQEILPQIMALSDGKALIIAMVKPQFEAGEKDINKGVVKNEALRRKIFKNFEQWARKSFVIVNKADSSVAGEKGNLERFYLLSLKKSL